jgi:hypothetical protein
MAAMDHDLHAVRPPTLVGIADETHVARKVGLGQIAHL